MHTASMRLPLLMPRCHAAWIPGGPSLVSHRNSCRAASFWTGCSGVGRWLGPETDGRADRRCSSSRQEEGDVPRSTVERRAGQRSHRYWCVMLPSVDASSTLRPRAGCSIWRRKEGLFLFTEKGTVTRSCCCREVHGKCWTRRTPMTLRVARGRRGCFPTRKLAAAYCCCCILRPFPPSSRSHRSAGADYCTGQSDVVIPVLSWSRSSGWERGEHQKIGMLLGLH